MHQIQKEGVINIDVYSYGLAFVVYFLLAIGLTAIWRDRVVSLSIIICVCLTAIWAAVLATGSLAKIPPTKLMSIAEVARNLAWMFVLNAMLSTKLENTQHFLANHRWLPWYCAGIMLVLLWLFAVPWGLELLGFSPSVESDVEFFMFICFAVAALTYTELIYRLSDETERKKNKYMVVGLGTVFAYDFLMYSEALIHSGLDPEMWQARGIVIATTSPLIVLAVKRSDRHSENTQAPKHIVFNTFTLLVATIYLLYMAGVSYVIEYLGGTWSGVFQISFLSISALVFIVLIMSSRVRDLIRVELSKYFFSYRYDYRHEWLSFTLMLAQKSEGTPRAICQAMAKLCGSPSALLWLRSEWGGLSLVDHWQMKAPSLTEDLTGLAEWLEQHVWIIDIREWQKSPDLYQGLKLPADLVDIPQSWLVVPLMFADRLQGILLLCQPEVVTGFNWEERDLLKVAGRAAATHLAQYEANNTLVELRQFEAFNQLSAYVAHDLKNILAQQSLIVYNAEYCRNEPEFLDDVVETLKNSVEKIKRLMTQMRQGVRGEKREIISLKSILLSAIDSKSETSPVPLLEMPQDCFVEADRDLLNSVFGHLIQNAQEATNEHGSILIRSQTSQGKVTTFIEDNGSGMTEEFVQQYLFQPFYTTKGLTGMGIGAYESREYIRLIGGDITVFSVPNKGSTVSVILPLASV